MTDPTCNEFRSIAAEVALGVLSGSERADALAHMEHCVGCRALVESLAQTGDSLLLLAPEADPPMGFESRVAARVGEQAQRGDAPTGVETRAGEQGDVVELRIPAGPTPIRPKPPSRRSGTLRRRRTALAAAAAAAIIVGGTAAGVTVIQHNGSSGRSQVAEPTTLRQGHFQANDGRPVGQVYTYGGNPSWVFMNVDASIASGTYTCELQLANGTTVPLGQFLVHDGVGEWAHTVSVDVSQIKVAKLVAPSGTTVATARVA
jgi:hypothetical protein